ncbi:MAG: hypothetical protein JRG90_19775 [Deltaproteobacteria bacterium]|nr:hypothetical protein [Deltaproteobacteria bacterium]
MPIRSRFSRRRVPSLVLLLAAMLITSAQAAGAATPLPNGGSVSGVIVTTGQDSYEFTATAGDHIELRSPSDVSIATSSDSGVAKIAHDVTETGTFTVLVDDGVSVGGSYTLYFALIPGANEHGSLTNGGVHPGTIDLGDLDTYTFTASAGDHIELRVGENGSATLAPQLSLYAPSGALIDTGTDAVAAKVAHDAVESGTFTVLVRDGASAPRGFGDYNLYFALIPGANEHGLLTPGVAQPGTIDLGDLDTFTLVATTGETISLELQKTSGTGSGQLELYDPAGALVDSATSTGTASFDHLVAGPGTYTVLVKDGGAAPRGSGDYILTYTTDAPAVPSMSLSMLLLLAVAIAWGGIRGVASTAHHNAAG